MTKTVTATFKTARAAEEAVDALIRAGFKEENLSMVMTDKTTGFSFNIDEHTKAAEGVATGGAVGGAVGALIAGLVTVGAIATSGAGLLAVGPAVSAFAGAGAGAATGGLIGGLIGLGVPEHEAALYEDSIKDGGVLLAVQADSGDRVETAESILKRQDAHHIAA